MVFNNLGDFTSVFIPKRAAPLNAAKTNRMTLSGDLYSCTVAIKTIEETNSTLVRSMKKSLEKLKYVKIDYQESKVLANIRSLEKQIKLSSKEILAASKQGTLNELIDKQLLVLDYYVKFFNNYKIFYPERNLSKETLLKVVVQLINFQKDQSNHNSHLSLKVHQEKFIGKIKKEQNQLFHLSKHLGSGKSANVYEALDINTGNILAYKTSRLGDHDAFISIDNEYKILDILNSHGKAWGIQNKPHSVYQVIDKGQHNIGYLGEKFDGDLINAVDLSCDFTSPKIFKSNLFIAHQLLAALKYTQSKGILHGDIKPDNILTKQGPNGVIVCLADWGNAKKVDQPLDVLIENIVYTGPYFHRVSQSDTEEMQKSKPKFIEIQQKRDVFAMGTTLYQLFSGRKPYPLDENNFPITREGYTNIFNLPNKINQLLRGMLEFNKIRVSMADKAYQLLHTYIEVAHPLLAQKIHAEMSKNSGTVYEFTKLSIADHDKSPKVSEQFIYFQSINHAVSSVDEALTFLSQPRVPTDYFVIWPHYEVGKHIYGFLQKPKEGPVTLEDIQFLNPQENEESLYDLVEEKKRLFF